MCKLLVEKHKNLSENELIELVQQNDEQAFNIIFSRYLPLIKSIVSKHSNNASDFEDLLQDATISFYFATIFYDFSSSSFKTYCSVCIERGIVSSFKKTLAKKRIPLYMLVNMEDHEIISKDENPEQLVIKREEDTNFFNGVREKLSKLETAVLDTYIHTGSYEETAKQLSISHKSVDNALMRVRRKIKQIK